MKKSTSFRLSTPARAKLKDLAQQSGLSETQVLQALILQAQAAQVVIEWKKEEKAKKTNA